MSKYSIAGIIHAKTEAGFNEVLASAYNNRERPLCMCMNPGIPMYIARNNDNHFVLKRMPNSGQQHSPNCSSYEIPPELSGRGAVEDKAISEDQNTGETTLKLDFSLSKISVNRTVSKGEPTEKGAVKTDPTKLTIRSLLHYLYEEAELNKWTHNMEGKRSWFVIRKYLMIAAQNKTARKNALSDSLLIPESFSVDKKEEINTRQRRFFSTLKKDGNKHPMGILVGEVKNIEQAKFGYKMHIKHMPGTPFYMDDVIHKRLEKTFSTELAFFYENESIHLLTICSFLLSASGAPQIDTISLMLVDRNWIPFENIEELELLNHLYTYRRNFIKGLRYNLKSSDIIATALLTDTESQPRAVYVVPIGASDNYYEDLEKTTADSQLPYQIIDLNKDDSPYSTLME